MCSSSGGQNCIIQPLVSSHLQTVPCAGWERTQLSQPVHETATYRCDDTRSCIIQFWPPDDEHMCSKHVEAWNILTVKQNFVHQVWLTTKINSCYMFRLNCHRQGADTYITTMYSSKTARVINFQPAIIIHSYKNTKEKLP